MSRSKRVIQVGSTIGPYRLIDLLGSGGAGNVFAAEKIDSGEKFAVKVMHPAAESIEEIHARFIREISVAQKLNDPNVVSYHDCEVEDGVLYYAMEYVPWGSLSSILRSCGVLPWRDACECGVQISLALQHLHESGIIHRDIKPANIFLSDSGELKLGDFGLAKDFASPKLTVDGMTVGTAKYISPEQALGKQTIDARVDLYALGCNLFQLIAGRTPFEEPDSYAPVQFVEMMRRHIEQAPPRLTDIAPQCPSRVGDLVSRLLAKDPAERPQSASDVRQELLSILEEPELSDSTDQAGFNAAKDEMAPTLTERLRDSATTQRDVPLSRLFAIAALVLLAVAVAALASQSG